MREKATDQLCEEVGGLGGHAGVHAEALDVLQVGRQLRRVGVHHHVDEHRQEVVRACSGNLASFMHTSREHP